MNPTSDAIGAAPQSAGKRSGAVLDSLAALVALAVACASLIVAGLFTKSYLSLPAPGLGLDFDDLVATTVALPAADPARPVRFLRQLLPRIETSPGIRDACAVVDLPLLGRSREIAWSADSPAGAEAVAGVAPVTGVSHTFFRILGIPLLAGRSFAATDDDRAPGVIIVSESLARRAWPGADPLGRRLRLADEPQSREIVGVVGDVKNPLWSPDSLHVYRPLLQYASGLDEIHILTRPAAAGEIVHRIIADVDRGAVITRSAAVEELVSVHRARPRTHMSVAWAVALVALLVALACEFRVMARDFARHGGRLPPETEMSHVILILLPGLAAGWLGAHLAAKTMADRLPAVSPNDPWILTGSLLVLAGGAGAVAMVAERRARGASRAAPPAGAARKPTGWIVAGWFFTLFYLAFSYAQFTRNSGPEHVPLGVLGVVVAMLLAAGAWQAGRKNFTAAKNCWIAGGILGLPLGAVMLVGGIKAGRLVAAGADTGSGSRRLAGRPPPGAVRCPACGHEFMPPRIMLVTAAEVARYGPKPVQCPSCKHVWGR